MITLLYNIKVSSLIIMLILFDVLNLLRIGVVLCIKFNKITNNRDYLKFMLIHIDGVLTKQHK